jgi:hypothetical protein
MLRVPNFQQRAQIVRHREHPAFAILRRASIEPDFAGCEIHVPPLERQYLGGDPPAGNVRELHDRLQRSRQMRLHARELFGLKEARSVLFSRSRGMCGLWRSLPACKARLKIRFRMVSSRLSSAFDTPVMARRCSATCVLVPVLPPDVVRLTHRLSLGLARQDPASSAGALRPTSRSSFDN